jgi:hypothetical protein
MLSDRVWLWATTRERRGLSIDGGLVPCDNIAEKPRVHRRGLFGPGILERVSIELNNRPRKRLGWRTPAEAFDKLLSEHDEQHGVADAG